MRERREARDEVNEQIRALKRYRDEEMWGKREEAMDTIMRAVIVRKGRDVDVDVGEEGGGSEDSDNEEPTGKVLRRGGRSSDEPGRHHS